MAEPNATSNTKPRGRPPPRPSGSGHGEVPGAGVSGNTKSFVEVENMFEDRAVSERYLPRAATRAYPPGRGYGDGLLKMYRDRAAQLLFHQGDQRWRNREQKLARLQEIADSIFFQVFRVYAIARTRYHARSSSAAQHNSYTDDESMDESGDGEAEEYEDDDGDDGQDVNDVVNDGADSNDDHEEPTTRVQRRGSPPAFEDEDRVAFSRAARRDIRSLLSRCRFLFAETNTRRVGRGDAFTCYGSKTPEQRAHQIATIAMLHQHFHAKILSFKSSVEDTMVMRMLKTRITSEEATELFLICDTMYELIERQKIIANAYERSLLMFAECVDFEKCVHSLYLTKLQLLNELRHTYNGNELNKDWLLVNEMLTVREHDVIMYERMLNYAQTLLKPPYTMRNLSAFAFMCDVRNDNIHRLVLKYFHNLIVKQIAGHGVFRSPPIHRFLEFLANRALGLVDCVGLDVGLDSLNSGGNGGNESAMVVAGTEVVDTAADGVHVGGVGGADGSGLRGRGGHGGHGGHGSLRLEYPSDADTDHPRVQQFWHAVLVHCVCLLPSAFISAVYTHVAKREMRWEIRITDILRYVDWLCGDDPTYTCYTQKMVYRYLTFDESALTAQFSTLYDHECVLFALLIPNRLPPLPKVDQLRSYMSQTVNVSVDMRQRPFRYGYTSAEHSSPRRSSYAYPPTEYLYGAESGGTLDAETDAAAQQPHRPFTYDPRVCHTFPHLNQNYYKFVQHFYDLDVYRDTLRNGVNLVCQFLEGVLARHQCAETCNEDDNMFAANMEHESGFGGGADKSGSGSDKGKLPAAVLHDMIACLQSAMNFLNGNCWYYDGSFIHLNNANPYYPLEKKKFLDRLRAYKPRFKQVHESLNLDTMLNVDEMVACCYRFVSSQTGKTAKIAKVVGNTHSATGHSSVNQSFLRVNHGLMRVVMTNVHVNMYELIGPCVLFLLSLDTRNFGTDDGDQFPFGVNQNAVEFVLQAWQSVPEYVRTLVSVDSFATLLYAPLVREKRHETIFTGLDLAVQEHQQQQQAGVAGVASVAGVTSEAGVASETASTTTTSNPKPSKPTTPSSNPQPPAPKRRKKRCSAADAVAADSWDSLTGLTGLSPMRSTTAPLNSSSKTPTKNADVPPNAAPAATPSASSLPPPSNQKDKFVPYTIDREEFFQLANHLNLEWAHQAYSRLKSFKYFLAAMMQLLNQYGDRLFLYENGLRLSANVLLQRVRSVDERRRKRQANLFADYGGDETEDSDPSDPGGEGPRDANGGGGVADAATATSSGAAARAAQRRAPELARFNLSQLLDTNTNATTIAQFFSGMIKQSLSNEEALTRFKNYFNRLPSDEARQLMTGSGGVDPSKSSATASGSASGKRQWCSYIDPAHRTKGQGVRPLHEELLLLDNLTDLLFDLFHDSDFFDWVVETVNRGELYTNNLLDFADKTFVGFFAAYLYVLRTIDTHTATAKSMGRAGSDAKPSADFHTLSDYFWRNGSRELASLRRFFVARQISSPNLLNTAIGLRKYIDMRHERNQLPVLRPSLTASKRDAICYFIMCTYTFSDCNLAYALFMFRLIISIKFPGSWTKTITILQGSSNSGKSEFVEMVRSFFNSTNGVINPNVWRSATTNDIGTNLFPLMENLVCQSDEVDCINNTLLKTVVSKTAKQCRSFGSQESQQLHNLSKVFMSVNKQPHVDDPDDGVLTRMQIILPVFHKYQPRIRPETDTTKKHDMASFSPSHQFSFGLYPIGAHTLSYIVGLFYCYENYGPYVVSKNAASFKVADAVHLHHLSNLLAGAMSTRFSSATISMLPHNRELQRHAVFVACHTNVDQTPQEFLMHASNPSYYLSHNHVSTVDNHDTKVFVDLTNQPMIAALFRIDSHANMDPMVKFDSLYKVKPTAKPIDWVRIERVLRDHLIEFYNTEERGDSYSVASTGGTAAAAAAAAGAGFDVSAAASTSANAANSSNSARYLSRRINFKAFYDRFKNRFAHLQYRDPQTRQVVPNKWCLVIRRLS